MNSSRQRLLAVLFSVLLVTLSFGSALADPPGNGPGGPPTATPGGPNSGPPTGHPPGTGTATPTSTPTGPDTGPDSGPGRGPPDGDSDDGPGEGRGPATGDPPETLPGRATNASDDRETTVNTTISLDERGSALAHRLAAIELLRNTSLGPGHGTGRAQRYATLLNDTRQYVLDPNRTTSAALFRGDKRVVAPVHRRAPDVAAHVLISESILVETAIKDAERVRVELRARNLSFNESAVAGQLNHAERAYQQGERLRDRDEISPGAVEHYRRAWTHAQRALDIMDEAVVPRVTVRTQEDLPKWNASNHSINGTVFDVRGYELSGELVTENSTRPVQFRASTVPGSTVQFNASVEFPPQPLSNLTVVNVTVNARDPGDDVGDRAYDEEDQRNLHGAQLGRVTVGFDGDGLPTDYERTVTGTNPFDADSDFGPTPSDEGNNDVVEARENVDDDSLNTFEEFRAGTDPFDADTDDDGLLDGFEHQWPTTSPLTSDTDDDGVPDGQEDPDGDRLVNRREATLGTRPLSADSDRDSLNDSVEVRRGTDPTAKDSDGDGLSDPQEFALGTRPTDPDTDGDGVVDGNETYTRSVSDEDTGVSAAVTGQGFAAEGLSVKPLSTNRSIEARLSPVVRISNRTRFEAATVTVPLDGVVSTDGGALTASSTNEGAITILKWDPTTRRGWRPVPTTVDAENGTASASVSSFSYFVVVDEEEWNDRVSLTVDSRWPVFEPFDDLTGWTTEGDAELEANGTLVLESTASEDGGGGNDDGGDDGDDDDDESDDDEDGCSLGNSTADCDGDGLDNGDESLVGTEPLDADTDGDGLEDGAELHHDANPLVVDTDSDGLEDGPEVHVHGTEPDEADTDGGGASDGAEIIAGTDPNDPNDDLINEQTVADQSVATSTATRILSLNSGVESIDLRARLRANVSGPDSAARIVVKTEQTTVTVFELQSGTVSERTVSADLTRLAGTEAAIRIVVTGTARVAVSSIEVRTDTDGDGLRDVVENKTREARLPIPVVRENSLGNLTLHEPSMVVQWDEADTDGDGLEDGAEVELSESLVPLHPTGHPNELRVRLAGFSSHPNFVNSDGMGLNDSAEANKGSRALVVERLIVGMELATLALSLDREEPKVEGGSYQAVINDSYNGDSVFAQPSWLPESNIDVSDCPYRQNCTYIQFRLALFVAVQGINPPAIEFPRGVTVNLGVENRPHDQLVYPPQGPNGSSFVLGKGSNIVNLVIRTKKIGNVTEMNLGRLRFGVLTRPESRFYRSPHPPRQIVGDDFGAFTYLRSARPYETFFVGQGGAKTMVSSSMRHFESGLVAATSVYAPNFAKLRVPTTPSGPTTEAGAEAVRIILQNKASARRASIHVDSYQPELIESLARQARPAVMAGPVLVREN